MIKDLIDIQLTLLLIFKFSIYEQKDFYIVYGGSADGGFVVRYDLEDEDIDVIKQAYREYKEEGNPPILGEEGDEIEYE